MSNGTILHVWLGDCRTSRIPYFGPRDAVVNVLPPNLLFVLVVVGMGSVEEGPCVTLNKLEMLTDNLTGKPEALGLGEAVGGLWPGAQAAFAATYKDG